MPSLPVLSGSDVTATFGRIGWQVARRRGSHIVLVKDGHGATLSVPDHREVARGTSQPYPGIGFDGGRVRCRVAEVKESDGKELKTLALKTAHELTLYISK